jgi:hypothetical protein
MRLLAPSLAVIGLVVLAVTLSGPPAAQAGDGVAKFKASQWRLTLNGEEAEFPISLSIKGKASAYGNEYLPFRWKVPDARPYLPILQACGTGQLQGQARLTHDRDDKPIDGQGPLKEISCLNEE